jgi:RNA polymerase sigma-70 factor, ECF subfamily
MSADDDGLVARAQRGDREAFGALVRKYQRRVYATAFNITGAHGDADDVAQEALIRAFRGLARFDGRSDFFTWLYRIVVNVALNHVRARKRSAAEPLDGIGGAAERLAHGGADPRAVAESRELYGRVLGALAELSPTLRVTLVLAAVEELPYKKIAELMECPEGTVAWRVNQARKVLRQKLQTIAPMGEEMSPDDVLRRAKQALGAP